MRRTAAVVIAGGALILLVGCGGQKPQASSGGQTGGSGGSAIVIEATEFAFSPKTVSSSAGTKTFELQNKGTIEHDLKIDALNIHTGNVAPGSSKTASGELRPGTYEFYCTIPGHKEAGMVGTLNVT
jgi:uncharacterized cupredoxin-like copper-binding protein